MRLGLVLAGVGIARAALAGLRPRPSWERTNYRGRTVSLSGGIALASAATITAAAGAGTPPLRAAALGVGTAGGLLGAYDDHAGEQAGDKGLQGHLGALRSGRVSAGAVKLIGLSAAGVVAAGAVARGPVQRVVAGGVIAGTANLINLLDLRPGRALKATLLVGLPLLPGPHGGLVAGPIGAAAGVLPDDLGERVMLGDTGANAIGALLGLRLAAGASPAARWALLAGLAGLTVASEKVSFSKVIAATPGLRELDALGRK